MRSLACVLAVAVAASLGACGGNGRYDPRALRQGWNAVDGMICADGSPTGNGVSLGIVISGSSAGGLGALLHPSSPGSARR